MSQVNHSQEYLDRVREAQRLRSTMTHRQIGEKFGVSLHTVRNWLYDPDNNRQREWQAKARGARAARRAENASEDVFCHVMPFTEENVRDFCESEAYAHGYVTAGMVIREFDVSPSAATRALTKLVERGTYRAEGERKDRRYYFVRPEAGGPTRRPRGEESVVNDINEARKRSNAKQGTGRKKRIADKEVRELGEQVKTQNPGVELDFGGNKVKIRRGGKVVATLPGTPSSTSMQSLKADMRRAGLKV